MYILKGEFMNYFPGYDIHHTLSKLINKMPFEYNFTHVLSVLQ